MKYIRKSNEPAFLFEWKNKENDDWKPSYGNLQRPERPNLCKALIEEQGYICCYCEARISIEESHIEHFRPQSKRPDLALHYDNMFLSCGRPKYDETVPEHCGVKKADWYEEPVESIIASPLWNECENIFAYSGNGEIRPIESSEYYEIADKSIKLYGLDHSLLNAERKAAIDTFIDNAVELNEDELYLFVNGLMKIGSDGRHTPFSTTIIYVSRDYFGIELS